MRTFPRASEDDVAGELSARWAGEVRVRQIGGYLGRNQVFAVEGARACVVKVFHHQARRRARREAAVAAGLGGGLLRIAKLVDQGVLKRGPPWVAFETLEGQPLEALRDQTPATAAMEIYEGMGQVCAALHAVRGVPGLWRQDKALKYARARDKVLAAARPPEGLFKRAAQRMASLEAGLAARRRRGVVHGDFSGRNLLVAPQGPTWRITGLVDFEMAHVGDPMADVAKVVLKEFADPEARHRFLSGYLTERRVTPADDASLEFHLLGLGFEICNWAWADDRAFYDQAVDMLDRVLRGDPIYSLQP
ncbi:MAG: phosphotransferase family protein [Phenylobacterium sp.]